MGLSEKRELILGTAFIDMYAKTSEISVARKLFDEMPERNRVTSKAMICDAANYAPQLFREMELHPNDVTFVEVLTAMLGMWILQDGSFARWRRSMELRRNWSIMAVWSTKGDGGRDEVGGRCGGVWRALLTACRTPGDLEIAETAVEKMLRVDPGNHGGYVVLSNMYAEVGRWEDVERLRRVMDGGMKKIHGWSSVDGDKR